MAIRIEQNLFYIESKGLSLILENRDGYMVLKHLGRPIPSYHFSNTVHEKDHAFAGNQHLTIELLAWIPSDRSWDSTARRFSKTVDQDPTRCYRSDRFPLCWSQHLFW